MLKGLKYVAVPLSFFMGVCFADDVVGLRSCFYYQVQQGFYSRPYDLRVERKSFNSRIEVYLVDVKTGDSHMVGPKMFVGSPSHRISSVLNIPKEYAEKKNLSFLVRLYDFVFD